MVKITLKELFQQFPGLGTLMDSLSELEGVERPVFESSVTETTKQVYFALAEHFGKMMADPETVITFYTNPFSTVDIEELQEHFPGLPEKIDDAIKFFDKKFRG